VTRRNSYLSVLKAQGNRSRNKFADALAEGMDVEQASAAAGVCFSRGKVFLKEIRQKLGPQAV
jgi:hypothetical protein